MELEEILSELQQKKKKGLQSTKDLITTATIFLPIKDRGIDTDLTIYKTFLIAHELGFKNAIDYANDCLEISSLRFDDGHFLQAKIMFEVSEIFFLGKFNIDKKINIGLSLLKELKKEFPFDNLKNEIINLHNLVNNKTKIEIENIFEQDFFTKTKIDSSNIDIPIVPVNYYIMIEDCNKILSDPKQKKEFRQQYYTLAWIYLKLNQLANAKKALIGVITHFIDYQPGDMILCLKYHKMKGELENEQIAYYAGLKYFHGFSEDMENETCDIPKGIKSKKIPKDIENLFKNWINDWLSNEPKSQKK